MDAPLVAWAGVIPCRGIPCCRPTLRWDPWRFSDRLAWWPCPHLWDPFNQGRGNPRKPGWSDREHGPGNIQPEKRLWREESHPTRSYVIPHPEKGSTGPSRVECRRVVPP